MGLFTYIIHQFQRSDLYEKDYIFCDDTAVKPPKEKKNLVHIYLESMETTYALKKDGGNAQEEILPYLTSLTKANISFSHQEKIGGAKVLTGMGWTTGGMVASSAGVPLNFPFYHPFCKNLFLPLLKLILPIYFLAFLACLASRLATAPAKS